MDSSHEDEMNGQRKSNISSRREPRVVVVGAGLAGVGAVGILRAGGIRDVILLEAGDKPGGRVRTLELDDGFVELGAQFLHGESEIYNIAQREGMLWDEDSDQEELPDTLLQFRDFLFHSSDGLAVNAQIVNHNLEELEDLISVANDALKLGEADDVNVSLGEFFTSKYPAYMSRMMGTEHLKNAMIRWLEDWECQDSAGTVAQLSLPGAGRYTYYPGNGTRVTKAGMEAVFQSLLQESVPAECLRLKKAVKMIHWAHTSAVNTSEGQNPQSVQSLNDCDANKDQKDTNYCLSNNLFGRRNLEEEASWLINHVNLESETTNLSDFDKTENGVELDQDKLNNIQLRQSESNIQSNQDACNIESRLGENIIELRSSSESSLELLQGQNQGLDIPSETEHLTNSDQDHRTIPHFSIKLECQDGDEFYADHVIVTSSIGFLRTNSNFFQPPLSSQHQASINSMGFGNVAKIFLIWESEDRIALQNCLPYLCDTASAWRERIFGRDVEGLIPLWIDGADVQLKSAQYSRRLSNGRHWYEEVSIYHVIHSHDFCIVAWVAGEAAITMESLPIAEVKDVLHELLAIFLGKHDLPPPSRLIRSEWYNNPYTRGAYSYLATGVPLEHHETLREPWPSQQNPLIQLAGEACSKHYYSTAHGALESGQDAAHVILRHCNRQLSV